ncbi:unnamed protein product [Closterium sp. NIES-64]|nr:unnamed protein product [Closterium sp. NIES-64]
MGRKLPRNGSNELTDSLLLTAWLATVAPATSDRPSILSDSSLLSPLATVNYFAFGSNLNLDLLQRRSTGVNAPLAHVLGSAVAEEDPVVAEPAVVYHHRLAFNIRVLPPFEPALACGELACGELACGELACGELACGELACGELACGELACGELACGELACGELACEGISRDEQRPYIEHLVTAHTYSGSTVQVLLFPPPHRRSFSSKFPFSILFLLQALTLRANPNSPSFLPPRKELPPSARYRRLKLKGARCPTLSQPPPTPPNPSLHQALTLRANPKSPSFLPPRKELPPSARYRGLLLKGARKAGLRREYVEEMRRIMDGKSLDGWWQWW